MEVDGRGMGEKQQKWSGNTLHLQCSAVRGKRNGPAAQALGDWAEHKPLQRFQPAAYLVVVHSPAQLLHPPPELCSE